MALQISLLTSDLEHLATNFRLLSREFLILQDFIRQQYGTKFTTFYDRRKDLGNPPPASAAPKQSPGKPCPKSKKARESNIKVKKSADADNASNTVEDHSEFGSYAAEISDASNSAVDDGFFVVSVEDNDNTGDNEEEGYPLELPADISLLYENDPDCSGVGKKKSIVHRYFKMVTANDGSSKAKCKHCGMCVSKQAQRLRNHLLKCFKNDKKESLTKLIHSIPQKREEEESTSRIGRKSDRVRLLFTKVNEGLARPQMKCKLCGMLVSNQPVRLKNHVLNRCPKREEVLPNELNEGSGSDSNNETSVRNVNAETRKSNKKRKKVIESDSEDDDGQTNDEDEGVGNEESAKRVRFRDQNEQSDNVPSTSGVSTPYLTICSSDLLDVASHIGNTT